MKRSSVAVLSLSSIAACCPAPYQGKKEAVAPPPPAAPSAEAPPPAPVPAPSAAPPAPEGFRLKEPAAGSPVDAWVQSVGCSLIGTGDSFACLEGGGPAMGFTEVRLAVRGFADAAVVQSFVVYNGRTDFDAEGVKSGWEEANAALAKGGFAPVESKSAPVDLKLENGALVHPGGTVTLPPLSPGAPTPELERQVETCCEWRLVDQHPFASRQKTVVELERACRWGRDPEPDRPPACVDSDFNEENVGVPEPAYVVVPTAN